MAARAEEGHGKGMHRESASGLSQVQQVTDPNNQPSPQDDELPPGVMFPINPGFEQQWVTGPQGAQPKTQREGARTRALPQAAAYQWGHADALEQSAPMHKSEWQYSPQRHGDYLRSYNQTAGVIHGQVGRAAMTKQEYDAATGRPDLHAQYLEAYARGRDGSRRGPYSDGLQAAGSRQVQADTWTSPAQTTDDQDPPFNSPATTPQPSSQNTLPQDADYSAGLAAGKADKAAGQRPAFADNSSGVSPYVKGYATGYGAPGPQGAQDVPASMGGDSGQAASAQEAQRAFQVARASRTASLRRASASFAPDSLMKDPDFRKGYLFAAQWRPGARLASRGSASFEAGLYAGITDRPSAQQAWVTAHRQLAKAHPELGRRIALHRSFTRKQAGRAGIRAQGTYLRTAGTTTDLITDGPGTSPDPMGATPINGPGTPPPMGGGSAPAAPGGAPPYQGAPPLPGGPVVPDDVMGKAQQPSQPSGPFTNTFSGNHPENADLAPVAPNAAAGPGYTNKDAYSGDPRGNDKLAAFRRTVQANLATMGAK